MICNDKMIRASQSNVNCQNKHAGILNQIKKKEHNQSEKSNRKGIKNKSMK